MRKIVMVVLSVSVLSAFGVISNAQDMKAGYSPEGNIKSYAMGGFNSRDSAMQDENKTATAMRQLKDIFLMDDAGSGNISETGNKFSYRIKYSGPDVFRARYRWQDLAYPSNNCQLSTEEVLMVVKNAGAMVMKTLCAQKGNLYENAVEYITTVDILPLGTPPYQSDGQCHHGNGVCSQSCIAGNCP